MKTNRKIKRKNISRSRKNQIISKRTKKRRSKKRRRRTKKYKQRGGFKSTAVGGLLGMAAGGLGSYVGDLDPSLAAVTTLGLGGVGAGIGKYRETRRTGINEHPVRRQELLPKATSVTPEERIAGSDAVLKKITVESLITSKTYDIDVNGSQNIGEIKEKICEMDRVELEDKLRARQTAYANLDDIHGRGEQSADTVRIRTFGKEAEEVIQNDIRRRIDILNRCITNTKLSWMSAENYRDIPHLRLEDGKRTIDDPRIPEPKKIFWYKDLSNDLKIVELDPIYGNSFSFGRCLHTYDHLDNV